MVSLRRHRNAPEFKSTTSSTIENSLGIAKSGISINKGASQREKTTGSELLESEQIKQLNETEINNLPEASSGDNGKKKSTPEKIKLQLFPLDDVARRCLELEKHNPYLELIIGAKKKISSVLKHLNQKWGKPQTASGELMLFPSDEKLNNLSSCKRWTINDSDVTATDVYTVIGSPPIFRLRYGWLSDIEIKASNPTSITSESKIHPPLEETEKTKTIDIEQNNNPFVLFARKEQAPATTDDSVNKNACNKLDDTVNQDNQGSTDNPVIQWDASNISFGAFLSEMSRNANLRQNTCDSFDAAIAQLKSTASASPVLRTSILDAEDTRTPFNVQKITSLIGTESAQTQDVRIGMLGSEQGKMFPDINSQTSTHSEGSLIRKLDLNMMESFGFLEDSQPSSKQFIGRDNLWFDGSMGNSRDAAQKFSLF